MKLKDILKLVVKAGIILGYVGLIVILILQALTPGNESSNISNSVGDKLNEVATDLQNPEVETYAVESVKIASVNLDGTDSDINNASLFIGQSGMISCTVAPDNANNPSLIYASSNEAIIEVFSNGKILAKSAGSATITVSSAENEQLSDSITVTVYEVLAKEIEITNIPEEICVGYSHRLEVDFTPSNTTDKSIIWESSDPTVLQVSKNGSLTAVSEGTVTITATVSADPSLSFCIEISVLPKPEIPVIPAEAIEITAASSVGYIGSDLKLSAKLYPADATGKAVWYSSDETVATVSQKGVVTCHKAGEVVITARCGENIESSINITVKEVLSKNIHLELDGLSDSSEGYSIKQGEVGKVIATLDENATIQSITFSSSDESVAKIWQDGVIEAVSGGSATITVSTSYEGEVTEESFLLTVERITLKDTMKNFYYIIRKSVGHFGAFLVLGILGALTYYIIFKKDLVGKLISFGVCIVAGFAVAGITEILQLPYFTQGRYCSFDDVMLDFKGYCCSAVPIGLLIIALHFIVPLIKKRSPEPVAVSTAVETGELPEGAEQSDDVQEEIKQ